MSPCLIGNSRLIFPCLKFKLQEQVDVKNHSVSFIVVNTSSIVLQEGNLAETGLIAFMTRNFQSSTYLKTDCWKSHKVPLTLASSKKRHTFFLLIVLCNFFSLCLFVISHCNAACLWLSITSAFPSFFSFPSPNIPLYFSSSIILGLWEPGFTILNYLYQYIHYKFTTNEVIQLVWSLLNHIKSRNSFQKVFR